MKRRVSRWQAAVVAAAALLAGWGSCAWCQDTASEDPVIGASDVTSVGKIGRVHDRIRRAQQRESLYQEISGLYRDYANWKARMQKETNVAYSLDVSLLQQWGSPDGGSPALQIYAAPSLDWTVFKSSNWGTGSIQVAYNLVTYPTKNVSEVPCGGGACTSFALSAGRLSDLRKWTLAVHMLLASLFPRNAGR